MAAAWARQLAARDGPIVTPQCLTPDDISGGEGLLLAGVAGDRAIDQHQYRRCRRQREPDDHRIARGEG